MVRAFVRRGEESRGEERRGEERAEEGMAGDDREDGDLDQAKNSLGIAEYCPSFHASPRVKCSATRSTAERRMTQKYMDSSNSAMNQMGRAKATLKKEVVMTHPISSMPIC